MDKTIALFINDLKYVTISLEKDKKQILEFFTPDLLKINAGNVLKRFSNEYDVFFQQMNFKLHKDGSEISRMQLIKLLEEKEEVINSLLFEIEKIQNVIYFVNEMIGFETIRSIDDLNYFMKCLLPLDEKICPVEAWFDCETLSKARELLSEIKKRIVLVTEIEETIKTVWKEEIFESNSIELIHEIMAKEASTLKFFNTSYWKVKKLIRNLMSNDTDLVTQKELEQLLYNLESRTEHLSWLKSRESLCFEYFGVQQKQLVSLANAFSLQMDAVACLTQKIPKEKRQTYIKRMLNEEKFLGICQLIQKCRELPELEIEKYLIELFPEQLEELKKASFTALKKHTEALLKTISFLKKDFDFFYRNLKRGQEQFTLNQMRSHAYILERLQQKCSWLKANELKMISLLDTTELQADSNWEELKMTAAYNSEVNFSEYKEADFNEYREETNDYLELSHMIRFIIEVEQPIHKETLRKRLMSFLGMKRMNAQMKDSMDSFLQALPDGEYEVDDGFVQSVHFHRILFRCVKEEEKKRVVELIAPSEWEAGVLRVVKVGQEVTLAQIEQMLMKALLMKRKTKAFSDAVERAVKELKAEDKIVRHSGGFRIVR